MRRRRWTVALQLALAVGTASAAPLTRQELTKLDLERELYRELHKLPPPAELPTAETRACYERLGRIARFTPVPIRVEPSQCARYDMVRLDGVLMPDRKQVSVMPAPALRCSMAEAVAEWIRDDVAPAAAGLGAPLAVISGYDSYECRPRNNVAGAKLSEHGTGNAIDIGAVRLANGAQLTLTDPRISRPFREQMRASACARFMTVLGPGSDSYHNEHIHLDLQERSHDYRICQWNVLDPPPLTADVPLPKPKPAALLALQQTQSK